MSNWDNVIYSVTFTTIVGLLLEMAGYITFTLINSTVFLAGQGVLLGAIALSNTPIAKGGAMVALFIWLLVFLLQLDMPLPSPLKEMVFAIVFVPSFLSVAFSFLEMGKG